MVCSFFFFKQKTAYEMRISDWSSDVCSSDLGWLLSSPPKARLSKARTGLKNAGKKLITASGIRKRFRDLKTGAGTGFSQNVLNSGKGAKTGCTTDWFTKGNRQADRVEPSYRNGLFTDWLLNRYVRDTQLYIFP